MHLWNQSIYLIKLQIKYITFFNLGKLSSWMFHWTMQWSHISFALRHQYVPEDDVPLSFSHMNNTRVHDTGRDAFRLKVKYTRFPATENYICKYTCTLYSPWYYRIQIGIKSNSTVETLYSTIYYSKYFIELNFDKSTEYVALWTHKRHPIPRPFGRAMECLLWVLQQKLTVL